MAHPAEAQVLVVGGGPVGMLVAAELAGLGTGVVLLEHRTTTSERPKATTLHARTVQCLARRGHLPGPVGHTGDDENAMPFHFAGIPGLTVSAPPTEPAPILKMPQADLERFFEARARAAGARILRGHEVVDLAQSPEGVRIEARGPQGTVVLHGRYAVGADGARSTVRRLAGFEADTWPATVTALMGQVRLREAHVLSPGWHRTPRGWLVVKGAPDGTTHLRTLNCSGPPAERGLPPTLEELSREASHIAGREIAMTDGRWLSTFSDFSRLARSYRSGSVFLAGDAAHVHFPVGGQGLSTGLLDAVTLGWKLALAAAGDAGDALLDTYDAERRPAARRVIDNTRAQVALMRPDPALDPVRDLVAGMFASGTGDDCFGLMISAQDTVLPARSASCWEGKFLGNTGLDTADGPTDVIRLLREGRPLLLLFGEDGAQHLDAARPWADRLRVVHCAPVPDLPCAALLVRPDGYIGWAPDGGGLGEVLDRYFGQGGGRRVPARAAAPGTGTRQPTG
ncbi:FAD-dependent monooxygenase [Streptomyces sp. NPDC000229]|uniref:FAD-dependent monooxygenase n=1 Tax=Streptomyces sp. NPDC000229 TaxID=3154247 RepID=UPI003327B93F